MKAFRLVRDGQTYSVLAKDPESAERLLSLRLQYGTNLYSPEAVALDPDPVRSFQIEVVETLRKKVEIEARSLNEAIEIAEKLYNRELIQLDHNDNLEVNFGPYF